MKFIKPKLLLLASYVLFTWSAPLLAQEKGAQVVAPFEQTKLSEAAAQVKQAEALYQAGDFANALASFELAYAKMADHPARYRVLSNMALCQEKLLRIDAALANYEQYLLALPAADADRLATRSKIEELKASIGYLKIYIDPGPGAIAPNHQVSINGQKMSPLSEYPLPAGSYDISVQPDGFDAQTRTTQVTADEHQKLSFQLIDPYKEAKERVARAEQLYEAGNYDAALTEFQRAYDTMVGHPARAYVLYNVARCQERLYHYDAAIASYKNYLTIAAVDEADRPKVEATIESLEGFLGTITLEITTDQGSTLPQYEVWVDGRLLGEAVTQFLIPGGTHQVEVRAEGFEGATKEVQVPSRDKRVATFRLAALAKEYKGISKAYFFTAGGLALASAATGATFGILAVSRRHQIDQKPSEAVTQADADSVKKLALYADVFFVSAGVFATSAVILAFLTDWSSEHPTAKVPPQAGLHMQRWAILPSPRGGLLSVEGSF